MSYLHLHATPLCLSSLGMRLSVRVANQQNLCESRCIAAALASLLSPLQIKQLTGMTEPAPPTCMCMCIWAYVNLPLISW